MAKQQLLCLALILAVLILSVESRRSDIQKDEHRPRPGKKQFDGADDEFENFPPGVLPRPGRKRFFGASY